MPDLPAKRIELILQQLEQLPSLPAAAARILDASRHDPSSVAQAISLVNDDPSLAGQILQLLHRADDGAREEMNSMEQAAALLGFPAVRSAVLAVSVFQTLGAQSQAGGHFNREAFWKHSIAVACCAELLATSLSSNGNAAGPPAPADRKKENLDPAEAFVCGLLHDLGKVALDTVLPKSFNRVVEAADLLRGNIADLERTVIGLDHMVVGKRLAERWQLPLAIRDCIWLHGQLPAALPATIKNPRMVNLITLADLLVREQHLGYSGNYVFSLSRQSLMNVVGLSREAVEAALKQLVEHIEPRAKALGLSQTNTGELYQQALAQVNNELGRVSGQLAAKNRRLAVRAKFLDALSGFQCEIRPDAPPQTVLQAIGQTAVGVLDVTCVGVFSLLPGQSYAEAFLFDEAGELFETTLIDCPKHPAAPDPGVGPVLAAGEELEWLLEQISPRLAHDHRFWICLQADGICIGGLVWGASGGEGQRLSPQAQELSAVANGWAMALRIAQIREEARTLAEQLAEANRQLNNAHEEILRSKTMISVGEMAAGAAHEMNNPLAIISGRSQLLASQLSDPKLQHAAKSIHEQSHRLSAIITELMDFAKPEPPVPAETDLADLVAQSLHEAKMLADPSDRNIEVTMEDVPAVIVDPRQLREALIEILDNSIQATEPGSGRIEIHGAFDPYGLRAVLTIVDNGCGMEENTLKHVFDPFFSSKPAGRRRGMGLAKALRWIESGGGTIQMESRPRQGTRTTILLPTAPSAAPQIWSEEKQAMQ